LKISTILQFLRTVRIEIGQNKPAFFSKRLPIYVVKELAGHSDIKTTHEYYLSIQTEDIIEAQKVQESLL